MAGGLKINKGILERLNLVYMGIYIIIILIALKSAFPLTTIEYITLLI